MKIRIEMDESVTEDEVIIRCRGLTEQVASIQKAVSDVVNISQKFPLYKGNLEYYLPLDQILFFETDEGGISATRRMGSTGQGTSCTNWRIYFQELLCGYPSPPF